MIKNKNLSEADITRRMLKTMSSKMIKEENETPLDNNNFTNEEPNIQIPINENTFPGILEEEKGKMGQQIGDIQFEDNPLLYNPSNKTVSFTGIIKNMNNLRWFYTTDTSTPDSGCFIFVEGLQLNDKTMQILYSLHSLYNVWVKDWSSTSIDERLKISPEQLETFKQKYSNIKHFEI